MLEVSIILNIVLLVLGLLGRKAFIDANNKRRKLSRTVKFGRRKNRKLRLMNEKLINVNEIYKRGIIGK